MDREGLLLKEQLFPPRINKTVKYLSPPLPLTPPYSSGPTCSSEDKIWKCSYLMLVNVPGSHKLLCYSGGYDDNYSVTISSLALNLTCYEGNSHWQTFEDWSHAHSLLSCTKLKCYTMTEPVQQIDSEVVSGVAYLCVTCAHYIMVCEITLMEDDLSCKWIDKSTIHRSSCKIVHTKLSPYIQEQVLVMTEGGGIYLYQKNCNAIKVKEYMKVKRNGCMCFFGVHPRHLLWLEEGELHSADLRTAELPLCSTQQPLCMGCSEAITCAVSEDSHLKPFCCFVTTRTHLILVDLRQPTEPLFTVLHHLALAPVHISCLHSSNKSASPSSLVLVCSCDSSVVFCYSSVSAVSVVTVVPHTVCLLSDMVRFIQKSDLYAMAASGIEDRFRQPVVGVVLLPISLDSSCYGCIIVTELGDLFYQCWQYYALNNLPVQLDLTCYQGVKLWIEQSFALRNLSSQRFLSGTIHDLNCVAEYLISGEKVVGPRFAHQHYSPFECNTNSRYELDTLKKLYGELVPNCDLEISMATEWERIDF